MEPLDNSLDPRIRRLPDTPDRQQVANHQLSTFEVFVSPKQGKPFQHEGIVHASDSELAFLLAKEAFTRRFTCYSLCVAPTAEVHVSPLAEGSASAFDSLLPGRMETATEQGRNSFEIYFLHKRGKQVVHAGTVTAANAEEAMVLSAGLSSQQVLQIWAIPTQTIRFTQPEELELWLTLPDKKYRDAADYRAGEKLKSFLQNRANL